MIISQGRVLRVGVKWEIRRFELEAEIACGAMKVDEGTGVGVGVASERWAFSQTL